MTIEEYFGDWVQIVNMKEADRLLKQLSVSKASICPQLKDVFKAFHLCSFRSLRLVILGQDPYPNKMATGLAFANPPDTTEENYSPSLEILRESIIDFTLPHKTITFSPSLEKLEEQGVLLLNSSLTCLTGQPSSHSLLWRPFIKNILQQLSRKATGIVYLLMGSSAQSFEPYIDQKFNYVFKTKHPAYYARTHTKMPSEIWYEINKILIEQNGYGIEWFQEE